MSFPRIHLTQIKSTGVFQALCTCHFAVTKVLALLTTVFYNLHASSLHNKGKRAEIPTWQVIITTIFSCG